MTSFSKYQQGATATAIYPGAGDVDSVDGLSYATLGLVGEAGEIANKVKKILRDGDGVITADNRVDLSKELGDVCWYMAALATQIGYPLALVAEANLLKLQDRAERGVLQGSGDQR